MEQALLELVASSSASLRVDRDRGTIRGVKILGLQSKNGRRYLGEALAAAVGLYEGAKVNVNHPKGHPQAARDYQDRIGHLRNVQFVAEAGLVGDLQVNPKHALAEQLLWDAEHAPDSVGLSHNVQARTATRGGEVLVESILAVHSVDLVADPATTRGLFESAAGRQCENLRSEADQLRGDIRRLQGEVDRLRAAEAAQLRHGLVRRLLAEHRLPDPDTADAQGRAIASSEFIESLLAAPDEAAMRSLVEQRARLVAEAGRWATAIRPTTRCQSREQSQAEAVAAVAVDAAAFARAIKA